MACYILLQDSVMMLRKATIMPVAPDQADLAFPSMGSRAPFTFAHSVFPCVVYSTNASSI